MTTRFLTAGALTLGLTIALATGSARAALDQEKTLNVVPRITIDELKSLMAKKQALVIDVRDPQSFLDGHIPGARHIVMQDVINYADELQKDKRLIVTYCA